MALLNFILNCVVGDVIDDCYVTTSLCSPYCTVLQRESLSRLVICDHPFLEMSFEDLILNANACRICFHLFLKDINSVCDWRSPVNFK